MSEAFTRPRVMEQLAKVGFTQSYTYFTWRSSKWELETYLNELTRSAGRRLLPAESLAEHAGHLERGAADRRQGRLRLPPRAGRHA